MEFIQDNGKVSRLELIDQFGRAYTTWGVEGMEFSYQDGGRTLKIFFFDKDKGARKISGS